VSLNKRVRDLFGAGKRDTLRRGRGSPDFARIRCPNPELGREGINRASSDCAHAGTGCDGCDLAVWDAASAAPTARLTRLLDVNLVWVRR
jgi:hypothetical protein